MKLNHYIRQHFGSHYPDDLNVSALKRFAELQGIPEVQSLLDAAILDAFDYEKCDALRRYIRSNEEWRKLAWCYMVEAYQHIKQKGVFVGEIGMGIIKSPYQTDMPNYHNEYAYVFSATIDRHTFSATKGRGNYVENVCVKYLPNDARWMQDALCTLEHLACSWQQPRFDLEEMGVEEDGYLSFFYTICIGTITFVFHTTERGFDVFALLRGILMEHPVEIERFLGRYAETLRL